MCKTFLTWVFFGLLSFGHIAYGATGGGVIDGNGGGLERFQLIDGMPEQHKVQELIDLMRPALPTWVRLLEYPLKHPARFDYVSTEGPCFVKESPLQEVRAVALTNEKIFVFCRAFWEQDPEDRALTVLHELSHFAITSIEADLGASEELIVQLIESAMARISRAPNSDEQKKALRSLQTLLDRRLPDLIMHAEPADIMADIEDMRIFNDTTNASIYPVFKNRFSPAFVPPQFSEYLLNHLWTKSPRYNTILTNSKEPAPEDEIWRTPFTYISSLGPTHRYPGKKLAMEPNFSFHAAVLPRGRLNNAFMEALSLMEMNHIRTIQKRSGPITWCPGGCINDLVWVFR